MLKVKLKKLNVGKSAEKNERLSDAQDSAICLITAICTGFHG